MYEIIVLETARFRPAVTKTPLEEASSKKKKRRLRRERRKAPGFFFNGYEGTPGLNRIYEGQRPTA